MKVLFRTSVVFLAVLSFAISASAQAPSLEGRMQARKIVKDRNDMEVAVPAERVEPTDVIEYTISYSNKGSVPAAGVEFVGPVPPGTVYIEDSALRNEHLMPLFSIDGGKSYQKAPVTYVVNEGTAREEVKKADPGMITHIRWEMKEVLEVSGIIRAAYRVRIK
ncbi:MAG: DUF11 domain-containing protein [Candidatus Latescibacteria bacterium]|nr:DUF11 domain-containing protein [bacterium]MBD3424728.1 DUF11 domain-containing protein [Candidatus Latescibacterota bacterium]